MSQTARPHVSATAWNPASPMQIVTASEDDYDPTLLVWDLRNARYERTNGAQACQRWRHALTGPVPSSSRRATCCSAPERLLRGHHKGVLSLAWCPRDPSLLLSGGKDNRAIVWNMTTGECLGDLTPADNWVFDVQVRAPAPSIGRHGSLHVDTPSAVGSFLASTQWNPRNPALVATASFDGHVTVHALQASSNAPAAPARPADTYNTDPFAPPVQPTASVVLKTPPAWLYRPCGATWGFGNKLVTFAAKRPVGNQPQPQYVCLCARHRWPLVAAQRSHPPQTTLCASHGCIGP